jgi:uncharacterized repeat protein (TIGR01451 family)
MKFTDRPNLKKINVMLATSLTLVAQTGWLFVSPARADRVDPIDGAICGTPGADGAGPVSSQVNTFHPGTAATVSKGTQSLLIGTGTGTPPIKKGDLLMIIQMQGAEINSNNGTDYGDGISTNNPNIGVLDYAAGGVVNGNKEDKFTAGNFEYAVSSSDVPSTGGTLTLTAPLVNSYTNTPNTGISSQGQKRFQIVRIPQYSDVTISSLMNAPAWDGLKGGIFAMDVAGSITFSGGSVNMIGLGFRGGVGKKHNGGTGSNLDVVSASTRGNNASKGEGIAGTPINVPINNTGNTLEGYLDGSYGRGAPGNAGGGGTDGNPVSNDQNAGGGGGGNGGLGGKGGKTWSSGLALGGDGGAPFPASAQRLVMGGGGGAGTNNNGTGTPSKGPASSGASGGGIVMIRATDITGTGSINVSGTKPLGIPANDASGGGGAGGSILVVTENGTIPGTVSLTARGGDGGTNTGTPGAPPDHGPGGGGAGGVIFSSNGALTNVLPGDAGTTNNSLTNFGGATAGTGTVGPVATTPTDTLTMISGANCLLKTTKSTSTPGPFQAPGVAIYTITTTNPSGLKRPTGKDISIQDSGLPTGFTYTPAPIAPIYAGGATGPASVTATGTPSSPIWSGFEIPPGGSVAITFTANIAATVTPGTYQNSATATAKYINTSAGSTTLSPNAVTSTYNGDAATNTADDVSITGSSALNVDKTVALAIDKDGSGGATPLASQTPTPGDVLEYTIVTTNPSAVNTSLGVILKDTIPVNTTYVAGSIQVAGAAKTDAVDTDTAEFVGNQVVTRLGTGATATAGGNIAPTTTSTIKFQVTINDPATLGTATVSNQAIVSSAGNPDKPSNDPTTTPPDDPTIAKVGPRLRLVKRITGIWKALPKANPIDPVVLAPAITPIGGYIDDPTAVNDDPTVGWIGGAAAYLQGITKTTELPAGLSLAPNDQVEYTIYFLADSATAAKDANLCDFVPANQEFVNGSLKLQVGAGAVTAIPNGSNAVNSGLSGFYAIGIPPACTGTNNSAGAAYVNLGNVPSVYGTPATAYGKFSFLATVK